MGVSSRYRNWRAEELSEPLVVTGDSKTPDTVLGTNGSLQEQCTRITENIFGFNLTGPLCLSLALSGSGCVRNTCLSRKHISHFFSSRSRHIYYFPEGKRKLSELGNI